jgi:hypothetical protein
MPSEETPREEGNLPNPVMDVLKDMKAKIDNLQKTEDKQDPPAPTVPAYAAQRANLQKRMGFTDDQMAAYEESQLKLNAPAVEQAAWSHLEKRPDLDKFRADIEKELAIYPQERRTPDIMEKIYFMVKGRRADPAPAAPAPKPGERVASSRVSGGPGYSGSEGGQTQEKKDEPASDQLDDREIDTARKLGVDSKRFALSRNSGKDITPLRKPDERSSATGADFELKRMQGRR